MHIQNSTPSIEQVVEHIAEPVLTRCAHAPAGCAGHHSNMWLYNDSVRLLVGFIAPVALLFLGLLPLSIQPETCNKHVPPTTRQLMHAQVQSPSERQSGIGIGQEAAGKAS